MLTIAHVRKIAPKANPAWVDALVADWATISRIAKLTTPARAKTFLAQTAEESGGFRTFNENLNYSLAALVVGPWQHHKGYVAGTADMKAAVERTNAAAAETARKAKGSVDACYDAGGTWNQETGRCAR